MTGTASGTDWAEALVEQLEALRHAELFEPGSILYSQRDCDEARRRIGASRYLGFPSLAHRIRALEAAHR